MVYTVCHVKHVKVYLASYIIFKAIESKEYSGGS